MGTLYRQRGSFWWISLSIGGRRQSTGKEKFKGACDVLKNISREQSSDLSLPNLYTALELDYKTTIARARAP
jgi:hypothetical protein